MQSKYIIFIVIALIVAVSCNRDYTPKPRGYMKVDYPQKKYQKFESGAPFSFQYPQYAKILADTSKNAEPWWYNIFFPSFDATIYLSYKKVDGNLAEYVEDSRNLAYKHSIKAEAIEESLVQNHEIPIYGIIYDLKGNTASSLQFFLTDSSKHFLRGSLYFNTSPNKDSLSPIVSFIREDLEMMIESFEWENQVK